MIALSVYPKSYSKYYDNDTSALVYESTIHSKYKGEFEERLTSVLKEYYSYISKDKPNNLFFTTNALRDYHYTKQKNNVLTL